MKKAIAQGVSIVTVPVGKYIGANTANVQIDGQWATQDQFLIAPDFEIDKVPYVSSASFSEDLEAELDNIGTPGRWFGEPAPHLFYLSAMTGGRYCPARSRCVDEKICGGSEPGDCYELGP